jgi:signal transduction histidine kinase
VVPAARAKQQAARGIDHVSARRVVRKAQVLAKSREVQIAKQIVVNLLSNAVKFTPDVGKVSLRARVVDGAPEVAVSDTIIGIAEQDREAVFEAGSTASLARNRASHPSCRNARRWRRDRVSGTREKAYSATSLRRA